MTPHTREGEIFEFGEEGQKVACPLAGSHSLELFMEMVGDEVQWVFLL